MTKDELTALRQLCAQAQEARADLDNDFPVGAVARGKWQDAHRLRTSSRNAVQNVGEQLMAYILIAERGENAVSSGDYGIGCST